MIVFTVKYSNELWAFLITLAFSDFSVTPTNSNKTNI
jgi:hypothetical protein